MNNFLTSFPATTNERNLQYMIYFLVEQLGGSVAIDGADLSRIPNIDSRLGLVVTEYRDPWKLVLEVKKK